MVSACGVLPVSVHKGEVYVLCGRERSEQGWSDSNKFAGFGGMKEDGESNRRCAARECYEESMGFLGTEGEVFKKLNPKHRDYIMYTDNDIYRAYLIHFEYREDLPKTYRDVYQYLVSCDCMTKEAVKMGCFEKTEVKYFKLMDLYKLSKRKKSVKKKLFRDKFLDQIQSIIDNNPKLVFSLKQKYM